MEAIMSNIFSQIAQNKKKSELEINPAAYLEQREMTTNSQEVCEQLKERNRFLESHLSRSLNVIAGIDPELIQREKKLDEKANLIATAIQKINEVLENSDKAVQNAIQDSQTIEARFEELLLRYNELFRRYSKAVEELSQNKKYIEHLERELSKFQSEHHRTVVLQQQLKSSKMDHISIKFPNSPTQEEYPMAQQNENNIKPMVAAPTSPFGYTNWNNNNNIYMRGISPTANTTHSDNSRIDDLEKKVAGFSDELRQIKELLKQVLGNAKGEKTSQNEKSYETIQQFVHQNQKS